MPHRRANNTARVFANVICKDFLMTKKKLDERGGKLACSKQLNDSENISNVEHADEIAYVSYIGKQVN